MAQTIEHNDPAHVNSETDRAALVALLTNLQNQLDELVERIDPAPAPLPDKISPATIYTSEILRTEWKAVCRDIERLGSTLNEYRHAAKIAAKGLLAGSNRSAWGLILNRLEHQTYGQFQSVHEMLASMHHQTEITAMLVTIAKAGALPEGMDDATPEARRADSTGETPGQE